MAAPDWWFEQFERDLAEHGGDGSMSDADYACIAEDTTARYLERMADEADHLRTLNKEGH